MPALPFVDQPDGPAWAPGQAVSVGNGPPSVDPAGGGQGLAGTLMGGDQTAVGTGDLTADYNTPIHVGGLILVGLVILIGLKYAGFRFNVDAGVGL